MEKSEPLEEQIEQVPPKATRYLVVNKGPNRKKRRALGKRARKITKFFVKIYNLSPLLQQKPIEEWEPYDALVVHEAYRLIREGRIIAPKDWQRHAEP